MTAVAFIGLGRMGAPMAGRLAQARHDLTVWNRTSKPDARPDGARLASTPALAVRDVDVVITMLADGVALEAVLDGPDGILAAARIGTVLVDMSTIGPRAAAAAARRCAEEGVHFVDAPVSGSVAAAQSGALLAMVGGDPADVAAVLPVLGAITARQIHVGPVGSGATMKLALNLMLAVTNEALAEALVLAERAGIQRAIAYEVVANSALASPYVGYKREAFVNPESSGVAFSVDLMRKDVALALALARSVDADAPVGAVAATVLDATSAAGLGEADLAAVAQTLAAAGSRT